MSTYYLRVEGINLNNFVYDTADLNTIRGGSLILLHSIDHIKTRFKGILEPISTGASIGLFSFKVENTEEAFQIKQDVEKALQEDLAYIEHQGKYHPINLTQATFAVDIQADSGGFVFDTEALLAKIRWNQMKQPSLAIPSRNTLNNQTDNCEFDLVRPGIHDVPTAEKTKKASETTLTRRIYGAAQKQTFYRQQTGLTTEIPDKYVNDLEELTEDKNQGNLNHKMAVIYLDGNSFTKIRQSVCKNARDQSEFDTILKDYRRTMLTKLLKSTAKDEKWLFNGKYRMEILLWGGDEIMWVVPAWQGWKVLDFFYQEAKDWEFRDKKLKHGAGIVFCHHNAPIPRIKDLACKLAETAKEDKDRNLFAYQIMESFDTIGRDIEEYRKEFCPSGCGPDSLILNGEEMGRINECIKTFKNDAKFPRRKVYQITDELFKDPNRGDEMIKEVTQKLDGNSQKALTDLDHLFNNTKMKWMHIQELWDFTGNY